jgi:hypothetical protein
MKSTSCYEKSITGKYKSLTWEDLTTDGLALGILTEKAEKSLETGDTDTLELHEISPVNVNGNLC